MTTHARPILRALTAFGLVAVLALIAWWAAAAVSPPAAVSASESVSEFSAERARVHQADLSRRPHPAGSAEAARVRDMILEQLRASGVDARVQNAVGSSGDASYPAAAYVENVIGKIPGSDPTGTVVLVAHYDAAPASLGAGDDGAGVATLLETARALATDGVPKNDVVLLFTDAEEAGMFGSEAFVASDPDGRRGGVALNIEARGSSGPAVVFETSPGNERLIGLYGASAPFPVATSFAGELYKLLPNDTDFTPMLDSGRFTGLNTSYLDGSAVYHSPEDSMERQSIDSLQHQGSNALAVTRALAAADLEELKEPARGDATYFPLLGSLAHYPNALVWPIAAFGALSVLAAGVFVVRRRLASAGSLGVGVLVAVVPLVVSVGLGSGLWALMTSIEPRYAQLEEVWNPGWLRAGLLVAVVALILAWLALVRRRLSIETLLFGGLTWTAALGVFAAAVVPGGSYVFALPALAGGLALTAGALFGRTKALTTVSGIVALVVLVPTVALLLPVAGIAGTGLALFFAALLLVLLSPALDGLFPRRGERTLAPLMRSLVLPAGAAVIAVVLVSVGLVSNRFTSTDPVPVALAHVEDADTGQAYWVSDGDDPTGWSEQLVDGKEDLSSAFPMVDSGARTGSAVSSGAAAPVVTVLAERIVDGDRELTLRISAQDGGRTLDVVPVDGEVLSVVMDGDLVARGGVPSLHIGALSHGEVEMTVRSAGVGPLKLRLIAGADGLEELPGYVERPSEVVPAEGPIAEMRFVATTATL